MSIESFISKYPAVPDLRKTVEDIKVEEGKSDRSLVVILAEQLIRECRDGIREELNKINPGNTMLELDQRTFQQIPEEDRQKMFVNYSGIVSGILFCSIEKALVERRCYFRDLRGIYDLATQGLQLPEFPSVIGKIEEFTTEQLSQTYSLAKEDKTLTRFLEREEGIQAMPATLREFVEWTGSLSIIRQDILPSWKERAKFLISP